MYFLPLCSIAGVVPFEDVIFVVFFFVAILVLDQKTRSLQISDQSTFTSRVSQTHQRVYLDATRYSTADSLSDASSPDNLFKASYDDGLNDGSPYSKLQMDKWRERGFVPDSDSESGDVGELDGLTSRETQCKEAAIEVPQVVITIKRAGTRGVRANIPNDDGGIPDNEKEGSQPVPQDSETESAGLSMNELGNGDRDRVDTDVDGEGLQGGDYDSQVVPQAFEPEPMDLEMETVEQKENEGNEQQNETPGAQVSQKPGHHDPGGEVSTSSKPADYITPDYRFWDPSSSPDELQFEEHITPKKIRPLAANDEPTNEPQPSEAESGSSSPLSSALSSIETMPHLEIQDVREMFSPLDSADHMPPTGEPPEEVREVSSPLDSVDNMPYLDEIPEDILETAMQRGGRSFRRRNPIQLRPYLLEDARYQNLLKARGLKPMRIPVEQSRLSPKPNGESQDQSFDEENNPQDPFQDGPADEFQFPPSEPIAEPRQNIPPSPKDRPQSRKSKEIITPNRPSSRSDESSSKRRKLTASYGNKNRTWVSGTPTQKLQVPPESQRDTTDSQGAASNISPSPLASTNISIFQTQLLEGFRFPPDISYEPLNSPTTEPRTTPGDIAASEILISSENETEGPRDEPVPVSSAGSEAEIQSENEDLGVKRMRKQLRRVLPASHVRVELRKQESSAKVAQKRQAPAPLGRDESAKGVAKRIMRTKNNTTPTNSRDWSAIPISDESDAENESPAVQEEPQDALAELMGFEPSYDDPGWMDDDIPEDNRIDDMAPPVPRKPRVSKPKKSSSGQKIQNRTKERPIDHFPPSKRSRMRQTDITSHVRKSQATGKPSDPKPKLPRLGILDAPDMADRPRQEQPQFMRIAARQARSRRGKGRGSPSRKFLRLGTKVDTTDANMSLHQWKGGNIRQNGTVKPASNPKQTERVNQKQQTKSRNADLPRQRHEDDLDTTNARLPAVPGNTSIQGSSGRQEQNAMETASEKAHRPNRPLGTGSRLVVNRKIPISSLRRNATRQAQLEYSRPESKTSVNPAAFKKSLNALNKAYNQHGLSQRYQLSRFLANDTPAPAPPPPPEARPNKPRRPRKHPPQRIDPEAVEHRQPEIIHVEDYPHSSIQLGDDVEISALHGFSVGSPYTIDFDITPLQFGTFFRESTFIGSGELSRSLKVSSRDLDNEAGMVFIQLGEQTFKWGQWNETVSSELSHVFDSIVQEADEVTQKPSCAFTTTFISPSISACRSIIRWISSSLSFADTVDRLSFVEKCLALNYSLIDILPTQGLSAGNAVIQSQITQLRQGLFSLVFANQVWQISLHDQVPSSQQTEANDAVKSAAQHLLSSVLSKSGLSEIRKFLEENKLHEKREVGIGEDHPFVEAYLTVQTILSSDISFKECFEDYVTVGLLSPHFIEPEACSDIRALERLWHNVFTILPLDEIDEFGIFQVGSRFKRAHEHWKLIKRLVASVLGFYNTNPRSQSVSFNAYCRALFHRCFYLMNSWGWKNCKIILDTIFDFFAKNTLYHLRNEQSHGSPSFLENLDKTPRLEVEPRDCCFHIFLKIVGRGLQLMSRVYEKKKLRNFAWRLLPNHGRIYPKEEALLHEDLDALKNHHDLLCTLYWATPDGFRPRLEAIRDLVHPASSYKEACSISIRSWARLARFKLSTEEDISGLEAFAGWHSYFTDEMLKQHSIARMEVESQDNMKNVGSRQILNPAITKNQLQIESILNGALTSLKDSIDAAKSMDQASVLLAKLPITKLFGLFNPKIPRLNAVVCHTLDVLLAFVCIDSRAVVTSTQIDTSEDSQDYGDWGAFDDMIEEQTEKPNQTVDFLDSVVRPSISRLVSNCFGEDQSPNDKLLFKVVDSWTSLIQVLVKYQRRYWSDYLNPYDGDSWASLRATAQTRKFTGHFLASLIEKSESFYSECDNAILDLWASSLVERDAVLKFQHQLTNALLNADRENPLFQNLPFSVDRQSKRYEITLEEFTERRLSLISSLLSNVQHSLAAQGRSNNSRKEEYRSLVEKFMDGMKTNYQELGTAGDTGHKPYVDFVHRVVEFLQQYTQGICLIDNFFTNPTTFPLPAGDPTYIVAKLKSYGLRLSTGKVSTQLIMFIQSVSERAAVDGQQIYLVDQLFKAMSDTFETGDYQQPTLRSFLLHCVFPAYVENAFYTPAAWILAKPILQSTGRIFRDLLLDIDVNNEGCLAAIIDMIGFNLEAMHRTLCKLVDKPKLLRESFTLSTLPSMFEAITSLLPVVDYIKRVSGSATCIISYVKSFRQFSIFAINFLLGRIDPTSSFEVDTATDMLSVTPPSTSQLPKLFHDARDFASRELKTWLKDSWSFHGGKYYVRHGSQPKEISVTRPEGDGTAPFFAAIELFFGAMEGLEVFPRMNGESNVRSKANGHSPALPDDFFLI